MHQKLEKDLLTLCVLFLYCSMEGGLPLRSAVGSVTVAVDNVVLTLLVYAIAVGCLARPSNPATGLILLLILKIRISNQYLNVKTRSG